MTDALTPEEVDRRRDDALRRALSTPVQAKRPKPADRLPEEKKRQVSGLLPKD